MGGSNRAPAHDRLPSTVTFLPMSLVRRLFSVGAVLFAVAIFVLQSAGAEVAPKRGGVLEFASTVEPGNYDCHGNTSFAFLHPVAPHYSTLLKFDTGNYPQIVGDLAQSWEVSPDRQTYTFKLRPNVLFHDGLRLTSADIKASYQRIVHPPKGVTSSRQVDFGAIGAIETPDPLTVIFHLQWP
ncbi:MAG TPA: ABC transporter substrate-binding protein, partial [Gemmatimonadaceae bacterium]|nr:ABC transporter substrate-binding protein [Gemmatimonadaceae bacterium]